ncbi:hypothetical protein LSH36_1509g00006 [Paralvinella palmiformis]|uniref:Uncharacterized protein n=1 Tax=Paralvinella palmiformis TaxID=53620 RepID=A0AAD9ITY3_9ANNE|nr:hypothetical protein LSH36_1509g00006 [Paralvinella palmiformis]
MLGLGKVIFIFPILWKLATGSDLVTFKLSPISKKPPESDQLFQIETSTAFQCTVVCIQNRNCLTVMYDKINLLCRGYYNHVKAENLRPNVNAWQVTYKAKTENLAISLETTCNASSELSAMYKCSNVFDGSLRARTGYAWRSNDRNVGQWIKLIFPTTIRLEVLHMWQRCALGGQARTLEIKYGDNLSALMNGTCDYLNCFKRIQVFSRYELSPAAITEWLKITNVEMCLPNKAYYFGINELKVLGRVMK